MDIVSTVFCQDCIKRDVCSFYTIQGDYGYCRYGFPEEPWKDFPPILCQQCKYHEGSIPDIICTKFYGLGGFNGFCDRGEPEK